MSDAPEQSRAAWRQLEHEWHRAQEGWRDSTTQFFAAQFWSPLERETQGYLRELETLMEVLHQAQQEARR
jgi:hypothetical protein